MTLALLRDARAALTRGDPGAARDALVAAWRLRRAPVLAELVSVLDAAAPDALTAQLAAAVTPRVATTHANVKKLAGVDDPRLATFVLAALANPPFCAASAEGLLVTLAATIDRLGDPRLAGELPAIRRILAARLTRVPMCAKVVRKLDAATARCGPVPVASAEEHALEEELVAACAALRKPARTVESLLAEVYASPNDDAPRMVLADVLLERGDPRGELITLQLARGRDGEPTERERELLKKHGKGWLGALATVLRFGKSYSSTRFERGFVAEADFIFKVEKKLRLVADAPEWATVETAGWPVHLVLDRAPLRALRELALSPETLMYLERRNEPLPSVTTVVHYHDVELPVALLRQLCPALTTLHVRSPPESFAAVDELGIRELRVGMRPTECFVRDASGRFVPAPA